MRSGKSAWHRRSSPLWASDYATVLQNGLNDYLSKLIALRAFYDASLEVDPQEFKIFTDQIMRGYGDLAAKRRVSRSSTRALLRTVKPPFGADLNSESVRHEAIKRARDGNAIATAQTIQLRNPISGTREGFLAVLPVYKQGLPGSTIAERRRNTLGVIVGAFQTGAIFESIPVLPNCARR